MFCTKLKFDASIQFTCFGTEGSSTCYFLMPKQPKCVVFCMNVSKHSSVSQKPQSSPLIFASQNAGWSVHACRVQIGNPQLYFQPFLIQIFVLFFKNKIQFEKVAQISYITITDWRLFCSLHMKAPRILGGHSTKNREIL